MKLGVVVLNYLNYADTIECIDSIKSQSRIPDKVVIVDNCSNNESVQILKEYFLENNTIDIIEAKKNLGFAQGNNLGIKYCLEQSLDNILVINNDTILDDSRYIEKLMSRSISSRVGIVGTAIIGKDGLNQNPVYTQNSFTQMIKRLIYLLFSEFKLYKFLKKKYKKNDVTGIHNTVKHSSQSNYILHGSALLFTPNFFEHYLGFYPETFLYVEENILDYMLEKADLVFDYYDDISIFHKEDMSSAMSFNNDKKIYKHIMRHSTMIALKVYFLSYKSVQRKIRVGISRLSYIKAK